MKRIHSEQDIDELRRAAQALAVISAWSGAGLFSALADGRARAPHELPADARAVALTAPVLLHLGLLAREGDRYALTQRAQKLLAEGALSGSAAGALTDLSRLDPVLTSGAPLRATECGVVSRDREATRAFLDMLYRRSGESAEEVARWLAPRLPQGAAVLDLGGGHGRYARALADRGLRVTLYDLPLCIELARERHGASLHYLAGDFFADELGGPYEAVLLSNIAHGIDPQRFERLLRRVRDALAPGGVAVIKDMLLDDHGGDPEEAAFFALSMLMYTEAGLSYSLAQLRALCAAAGLPASEHVYAPDQRFSLVFARKPG